MRGVRHIYSQPLDIRLGKLRVRRFSLNRHLPEKGWVESHSHRHAQFLLYLTGSGRQRLADHTHDVQPGSLFFLAPGCDHSFVEGDGRRPLCLAIDFDTPAARGSTHNLVSQSDLRLIRQSISTLHAWQSGPGEVFPREAGAVLAILDVLMRAAGLLGETRPRVTPAFVRRAREALLTQNENPTPVAKAAEAVGYHPDHLTRILKRETGMSASQLRAAEKLKRAMSLLQHGRTVADTAEACGFADPNYFSRWFRKQTGQTPRDWKGA